MPDIDLLHVTGPGRVEARFSTHLLIWLGCIGMISTVVVVAPMVSSGVVEAAGDPPMVTRLLVGFSEWFRHDYGWIFVLPLPLLAAMVMRAIHASAWASYMLAMLFFLPFALLTVFGLFLPIIQLIENLAG